MPSPDTVLVGLTGIASDWRRLAITRHMLLRVSAVVFLAAAGRRCSTTERVLRRTKTAVLAVPSARVEAVVLGKDGPRLEPLLVSRVVTPIVVPVRWQSYVADMDEERTRSAEARLKSLAATNRDAVRCETVVSIGRPAESRAATAEKRQAGMIVVGLMGEEAGRTARPGSIAYRLLCLAHVPVPCRASIVHEVGRAGALAHGGHRPKVPFERRATSHGAYYFSGVTPRKRKRRSW